MKRTHVIAQSRFARDLAGLLRLGYPPLEAVQKLQPIQSDEMGEALGRAVIKMRGGSSLSDSLNNESIFLPLFVRLIATSENSEAMPDGAERAAKLLEDLAARKTRCFLAVLYPTLVLSVVSLIFWALCVVGGGIFTKLFVDLSVSLPLPTRVLMAASQIGQTPLGLILFFGPLFFIWYIVLGHGSLSWYLYKLPFVGSWLVRHESVIFLNTLGHLSDSGASLTEAATLALESCSPPLKAKLGGVPEKLASGDQLSQALASTGVIPELAIWAIERREATESLRLLEIANMLDRELSLSLDRGMITFEPLIFFGVAIILVFFSGAVFLPLYQLIGNLG
jgi:type II secretory pathway component PulF